VVKAFEAKPLVAISKLDQFSSKDPFKPIEQLQPLSASNVVAVTGNGAGATSGGTSTPSGASTPGGGQGGTTPKPTTPKPSTPKKYTYVVDLTFRAGKDSLRFQSFNRLGMLPSQASPLLVYLGVDGTASQAAFLVDSTLTAGGEGQCRPSATSCGVVYLQPGEKETFDDGHGHSYVLLLDQIRKVLVKSKTARAQAGSVDKSKTTHQQPRRFLFPVLIDLVTGGQP
jgi:hypothetical protein